VLRTAFAALCALLLAGPVSAQSGPSAEAMARVMQLETAAEVMRAEGLALGDELAADMLGGRGGAIWDRRISALYDAGRLVEVVSGELADGLDAGAAQAVRDFFTAPLGRRILTLENDARRAMIDDDIEALARQSYLDLRGSDDPRLAQVARFIEVNDLVERNVAGALSSDYRFTRGMVEGGAMAMSEGEILDRVWASEGEIREDTREWLFGFLLMAYRPLSDAEMETYIDFSATEAGQALNAALFEGFEAFYANVSHGLGLSLAQAMQGSDL